MTSVVPDDPGTFITREQAAVALTACGFPIKPKTLAKLASDGGPPYQLFGARVLYRWGDLLAWARSRMTPPRRGVPEQDVATVGEVTSTDGDVP